jgi:hypothetical protein
MPARDPDVLLIGGGIMSAHLGPMLKRLDPRLAIDVYEAAPELARESSDGWNNAGTGHAGLCELNYTPAPAAAGAPVDVTKAIEIFARFEQSRQFWSYAVAHALAPRPSEWIRAVPHLSFVRGAEHVAFLRARHAALVTHPFFRTMEFTAEREVLRRWAPLLIEGRGEGPIAATKVAAGTDMNFGASFSPGWVRKRTAAFSPAIASRTCGAARPAGNSPCATRPRRNRVRSGLASCSSAPAVARSRCSTRHVCLSLAVSPRSPSPANGWSAKIPRWSRVTSRRSTARLHAIRARWADPTSMSATCTGNAFSSSALSPHGRQSFSTAPAA